jgi:hypothetical protein
MKHDSFDHVVDMDAEQKWQEVIERRSREMTEGIVDTRPEEEVIKDILKKLRA